MLVTKEFSFNGAHNLKGYHGKCERLHGHTWTVQVTVKAPVGKDGIAFDFIRLKNIVDENAIQVLDHTYLNDLIENPSAENIARWIWERLEGALPLFEIKIYETRTSFVTYRGDNH